MTSGVGLAVAVGEVAGEGAEDGPGGVEQDRHQRDGLGLGEDAACGWRRTWPRVDGLVVEAGEELGDDQADERAVLSVSAGW